MKLRLILPALLALLCAATAHGQLTVALDIKRRIHLRYEPILATVRITNLAGRDLVLQDAEQPWFGFDITGASGDTLVPPRNPDYHLDPLEIKIGETVKRTVDLTRLYGIAEFGTHRVKATIYAAPLNKLFASPARLVEITEGRTLWQQTVGVPDTLKNGGRNHNVKLLEFQDDKRYLYVRVEDEEQAYVFCTHRIGHMIDGTVPQVQFDTTNNLYILHLTAPKTYLLSNIGVNGEWLGQHTYGAPKYRPNLRRLADGTVQIVGGRRLDIAAQPPAAAPLKLSDRPPGLPAR